MQAHRQARIEVDSESVNRSQYSEDLLLMLSCPCDLRPKPAGIPRLDSDFVLTPALIAENPPTAILGTSN